MRSQDEAYLDEHGYTWSATEDRHFVNLIIDEWAIPDGLTPSTTSVLIRLPAGFNVSGPDMFWCDPPVTLPCGTEPHATHVRNEFAGRQWQRWSRHIGNAWRPGVDNVATYLHYVAQSMTQAGERAA